MKKIIILAAAAAACLFAIPSAGCADGTARTKYTIDAEYNAANGTLTAECTVDYYNGGADTDTLQFELYGNAYRKGALYRPVSSEQENKAYYDGASYGGMEIAEVSGAAEWKVCGEDENILEVTLKDTLKSGGRAEITINYTLALAKVNHRTGITRHTVNLGNFYPIACVRTDDGGFLQCEYYSDGDPFISDCADYMVQLTLPAGYTAATSGRQESAQGNTFCYSLKNARDFCMVLSDSFEVATRDVGGTKISYYYYDDDGAQEKLAAAADSLEYFEETFGEYCYPTLSVVQTGFSAGGMEYPALTMISDALAKEDAIYAVVHENAHQWWYAMAGSDQINCAWQDEGLAEYSALCFFENHPSYGFTRTGLINAATEEYRAYYTVYNQVFGDADTTMNRHLKDFVSDYEYINIAYNKSLVMFDTLRTSIGDEKFFSSLRRYFAAANGNIAAPERLFESFKAAGVDLDGFFESFTEGKVII